jgi:hypothetical protein
VSNFEQTIAGVCAVLLITGGLRCPDPNQRHPSIIRLGWRCARKRAAELGAAGLLSKPIDFGLLRQEIDQRLAGAS